MKTLYLLLFVIIMTSTQGKCDELDDLLNGKEQEIIQEIVIDGLTETDSKIVLQLLPTKKDENVAPSTLDKQLKELSAKLPQFTFGEIHSEPALGGGVKITIPVNYREPETVIAIGKKGELSIKLGADQLIKNSFPEVYFFNMLENGQKKHPGYYWMTKGQLDYDTDNHQLTATYAWGSCTIIYRQQQNTLGLNITLKNTSNKPLTNIYYYLTQPFNFPEIPYGYAWSQGWAIFLQEGLLNAIIADYGRGAVAAIPKKRPPCTNIGFMTQNRLSIVVDRLDPGKSVIMDIELRFGPGTSAKGNPYLLAKEACDALLAKHPWRSVNWPDRRLIAALFPNSAHLGAGSTGTNHNPRGWCFEIMDKGFETKTEKGRANFKKLMLDYARNAVKDCNDNNAQGMICWCLEGQEFPHSISYIGSPDMLPELAPEMNAIADEWFKIFTDAGLKVGVCIRPQELTRNPGYDPKGPPNKSPYKYYQKEPRTADGKDDPDKAFETLDRKIKYAKKRWGCTIFYVDSNINSSYEKDPQTGQFKNTRFEVMPYTIFAELTKRHPDCLIIPEHETMLYWPCTTPLINYPTPRDIKALWPKAFGVNLMQNYNLKKKWDLDKVKTCVEQDDILIFQGSQDPNTALIQKIYKLYKEN